jgi:adenosine/AMP kinase
MCFLSGAHVRGGTPERREQEEGSMELKSVALEIPEGTNLILGQSHFIKTIEDLYEVVVSTVPQSRFGLAFCEASGACLIRVEGNDEELKKLACRHAESIGAGHTFVMILKEAYPINILNAIKSCPEVCSIFCATANPVEIIIAETSQGRGVLGVIDGSTPKGIEGPADVQWRKNLLRKIGYKIS